MLLLLGLPARAATLDLSPGDDWCGAVNAASPGDVVRLAPGDYDGPCSITAGGEPDRPVTLEGTDPADRPQIVYEGRSSNVVDVLASHVVLRGLAFGPTHADIDAVKIKSGSGITVEGCFFTAIGGISVSANSADGDGLVLRGNELRDLDATGFYIGCHDGAASCAQTDVLVEDNLFDGVTSGDVGYALEIKLDSWGTIRRNTIRGTKGPGIEVYGSTDAGRITVVEGNFVVGSVTSGAIEIGGGPAVVKNNLVAAGAGGGIVSYDYGGRGLVAGVHVLGNTAVGRDAFVTSGWAAGRDLELAANASDSALPTPVDGVPMAGNVRCADPSACWTDAAAWDFWPVEGGPLVDGGAAAVEPDALPTDFCGQPRTGVPDAGAFEAGPGTGPGPLTIDFVSTFACGDPGTDTGGPDDTGATEDTSATDADTARHDTAATDTDPRADDSGAGPPGSDGCGCATRRSPVGPLAGLLGLAVLVARSGRRRPAPAPGG